MNVFLDKTFENLKSLELGEYENCIFKSCDFSETNFMNYKFIQCEFKECNLSMMRIPNTFIQSTHFFNCKMLGIRFSDCNPFGLSFSFKNCIMNHCDFYQTEIPKTLFKECQLHDVEFSNCDLRESIFKECDLNGSVFNQSILEKVDFRTAHNFTIQPNKNRIKKAKFSANNLRGLLDQFDLIIES